MFLRCLRAHGRWAGFIPGDLRRQGKGDAPVGGLLQVQTGMASATLGANGRAASQDSLRAGRSPKKNEVPLQHVIWRLLQQRCRAHHQPRGEVAQHNRRAADPGRRVCLGWLVGRAPA